MKIEKLREELADLEHDRWSRWEKYRESVSDKLRDGESNKARWERQRETPYSELSEKEKDSERVEADKTLEVVMPFIEQAVLEGSRDEVVREAFRASMANTLRSMAEEFAQVINHAASTLAKQVRDNMDPRDDVVVVLGNCAEAFRVLIERTAESFDVAAMPKPEGDPDPEGG